MQVCKVVPYKDDNERIQLIKDFERLTNRQNVTYRKIYIEYDRQCVVCDYNDGKKLN